jgi:hypothetical protein
MNVMVVQPRDDGATGRVENVLPCRGLDTFCHGLDQPAQPDIHGPAVEQRGSSNQHAPQVLSRTMSRTCALSAPNSPARDDSAGAIGAATGATQ